MKMKKILKWISTWDTSYAILIDAILMDSYCKLLYINTTTRYLNTNLPPIYKSFQQDNRLVGRKRSCREKGVSMEITWAGLSFNVSTAVNLWEHH